MRKERVECEREKRVSGGCERSNQSVRESRVWRGVKEKVRTMSDRAECVSGGKREESLRE